jgi:hypothetical protein
MRVPAMHGFPNRTPASTEIPGKTSTVHPLGALSSGESYALGVGRGSTSPRAVDFQLVVGSSLARASAV